ncbi:TerC family protein [uncultured Shewanella sp.]|uniref:TerC family protein n=1 Tax=uncultured Shewanella sp. TaxID=173975 RepID=UPI00260E8FC8|nr:TerC family protein [uncultured Shewanella sp.]
MHHLLASPEAWVALATLTALEIILGIDNIIFIGILVGRLPVHQRNIARNIGLLLAMCTRLLLLFSLATIASLTTPWFSIFEHGISGRDIILIGGGMFLMAKSTHEIHNSFNEHGEITTTRIASSMGLVLLQIAALDAIFSFDSVLTAIGLVQDLPIMATAIILTVIVMLFAAKRINEFVDAHPTLKMLALSFLILIGLTLLLEGVDIHVPKPYIYFAMAFSVTVEMLNIRLRRNKIKRHQVKHINNKETEK